jgi:hypothetical protein
MIFIALKMLLGDRTKYAGLLFGISFTSFLVTFAASYFGGMMTRSFALIAENPAVDVWVTDPAVVAIDRPINLPTSALGRVSSVEGVRSAVPLAVASADARFPNGQFQSFQVIGVDDATLTGVPLMKNEAILVVENLAPEGARLRDIGCLLGQVLDIAQNAEIPHVLIGDIPRLWRAVTNSPQGSRIHVAMQPLYDRVLSQKGAPTDEPPPQFKAAKMAAHEKFVSILKRYDDFIKPCSKVSLARHYPDIIARVHGDPYRFAAWLYDALGEAGRQGAANLEWEHLRDTAPRTESVNSAGSALSAYCDYLQSTAFEFGAIIKEPESAKDSDAEEKPAKPRKPFEPIPRRDIVPKVA